MPLRAEQRANAGLMPSILVAVPAEFASTDTGMDDDRFRSFYARTARPLRHYLLNALNDHSLADDVLQESYLRLLAANLPASIQEDHRKNYLFRIASNLLHHEWQRSRYACSTGSPAGHAEHLAAPSPHDEIEHRQDLQQVLHQLKPRQRQLLWLAYVERFSHAEIAALIGAKVPSIRPMLARARGKLAELLHPTEQRAHTKGQDVKGA